MLCGAFAPQLLTARPVVIHEEVQVELPKPYRGSSDVCLHGDHMLIVTERPDPAVPDNAILAFVHFARQSDGEWQFIEEVTAESYPIFGEYWTTEHFACEGGLAAFSGPDRFAFIFEFTGAGWEASFINVGGDYPSDVAIHGETVAFSGEWQAPATIALVNKDASGQWTDITYLVGNPGHFIDPEPTGPNAVEFAGTEAVATGVHYHAPGAPDETFYDTQIFDLINGAWQLSTLPYARELTLLDNRIALVDDLPWTPPGEVAVLRTRNSAGAWTVERSVLSDEAVELSNISVHGDRMFASSSYASSGLNLNGGIGVFNKGATGAYAHEAILIASDAPTERARLTEYSVDGDRVAAVMNRGRVYLFHVPDDLPDTQRLEETFEHNNVAEWLPWGDANWQLVTTNSGSRAFRQTRTDGGARAILSTFESEDQSIQADVRVDAMAGPSPWVGFMIRYTDPQNFYYLLVDRNAVQIRRMLNGVFGPIASAPFSLELGRTYRFRIEAIGSVLRAFVDGELMTEVVDDTHPTGNVALTMWRSVAEYDNVVVTTSPQATLLLDAFSRPTDTKRRWSTNSATWTHTQTGEVTTFRQTATSGRLTAINGGPTGDQIVSADIRPLAFSASGLPSAGLVARYVDAQNHYFAVLTNRNTVALRKRIRGATFAVKDVPFTVAPNTSYSMRLEAIGSSIRVYVNDALIAETEDTALPTGRYGLMTTEASADFDSFVAVRP